MDRPILVIDDDASFQDLLAFELADERLELHRAASGAEGLEKLDQRRFAAVVLDLGLPDIDGEELLIQLREQHRGMPCVVVSVKDELTRVVRCIQHGAIDYVTKPFDRIRLTTSLNNAIAQGALRARVDEIVHADALGRGLSRFIGRSPAVGAAISLLERAARSDVTVLLQGESGTGKEVAARALHEESARAGGPFIAVDCGALPEGTIESELFGHEKGAFTGAASMRRGCFEAASGGTIFLDEIGELRPDLQVRLLRVLQEREIQRVGANQRIKVDVRVIAATHRNLREEIKNPKGLFREDLYYRLAVFPIELPPLRERADDILVLAQSFLKRFTDRHRKPTRSMSPGFLHALAEHEWPGNVRELQNVIERAVILEDGERLDLHALPEEMRPPDLTVEDPTSIAPMVQVKWQSAGATAPLAAPTEDVADDQLPVRPFEDEERRIIVNALKAADWNVRAAADLLGLGRATIYRKIERYGLEPDQLPD